MKRFERPTDWILRYIKTTLLHIYNRVQLYIHLVCRGYSVLKMRTQYIPIYIYTLLKIIKGTHVENGISGIQ